jgi:hypothetical protein
MTSSQGETAVTTSALVVSGLYGYRKATETFKRTPSFHNAGAPLKSGLKAYVEGPLGIGELEPLGQWATGMGLTFILLSIATSINATFGGSFAILVAVGAVIGNGQAALKDLGHGLSYPQHEPAKEKLLPLQPLQPLLRGEGMQGAQSLQPLVSSNHPPVK